MNGATWKELKIVAEQAVRPVRATMARKRKIREELLAHLVSVFEEAVDRLGDEQAALAEARERFGDPSELSAQIQGVIPRGEWFSYFAERILLFRKGESALAHATRVAVSLFLWFAITLVLLPPILVLRGRLHEIGRLEFAYFAAGIAFAGFFFVMTLLGHGLRRAWFPRTSSRSLLPGLLYVFLSAPVVPIFGLLLVWVVTGDLAVGWNHFRSLCWSMIVVPPTMIAAIWQIAKEARDDGEWASLEIGERGSHQGASA